MTNILFKILLITLSFFSTTLLAQNGLDLNTPKQKSLNFNYLDLKDGLSQGTIFCIFQDSRGFLWFGTQYGLNRYDGYSFKVYFYDNEDSLSISDNFILSINEDKNGNLWIATDNGLNKFDFHRDLFIRYAAYPDSNNPVTNGNYTSVFVDKDGIIWAGTLSIGLQKISINTQDNTKATIDGFRNDADNPSSIDSDVIRCIFEDSKGRLWIGTDEGLNICMDRKKGIFKKIKFKQTENNPPHMSIWALNEDRFGRLLVGSNRGLLTVSEELTGNNYLINYHGLSDTMQVPAPVISVCEDNLGNIWCGTYTKGLFLWNENDQQLFQIAEEDRVVNLQSSNVYSIYQDRSNSLWFGTRGSLLKWTVNNSYFSHLKNIKWDKNSLSDNMVHTVLEDKNKMLWIGTDKGLDLFDPFKNQFKKFTISLNGTNDISENEIKTLFQDKDGILWIGTRWSGLNKAVRKGSGPNEYNFHHYWYKSLDGPGLFNNTVFDITEDKWGTLWIGTTKGIFLFNKHNNKFSALKSFSNAEINPPASLIMDLYQSPHNPDIIWIGTKNEGLYQLFLGKNPEDIICINHYIPQKENKNSLSALFVRSILEDKKGRLWAGTIGGGINVLNSDSSSFSHFGIKDGFPSDAVTGILEDDLGYLWISTLNGLCRFDPETNELITFTLNDGLLNNEFNGGTYYRGIDEDLYFGGINGLDIVHPERIQKNEIEPIIEITDVQLFNESIFYRINNVDSTSNQTSKESVIHLSYNENVLSFEFAALHFVNPLKNKYRYIMEGIETSWNYVGGRRFANYSKIPPGEYIFRVKASNNNNVWNEKGAAIKIIIFPPFWQTWLFRILTSFIFLIILYILYKKKVSDYEEKKKLLETQIKEKTEHSNKIQEAYLEIDKYKTRLEAENVYLQEEIKLVHNFENIITKSDVMKKVLRNVEQVASTDATVLILGESGVGKELLARAIHNISNRKNRPLVKVNCSALPANLIENELFGHEKGAFTGAISRKIGRFELANEGTIFLDEIGDMSLELQAKLLRVLQEGEFERLGSPSTLKVDVRVITATNRSIEESIKLGAFREDLYFRLNVFPILIPPLRERSEDIAVLVQHFVAKYSKKHGKAIENISQNVIKDLMEYHWPGNIRELENIIERAVIITPTNKLVLGDWFSKVNNNNANSPMITLEENERRYIIKALNETGWRISGTKGAAKILGLNPTTLEYRIKKLGINRH